MNSNVVHILLIVFISGVIGLNNTKLANSPDNVTTVINGENATDIPPVTLVPSSSATPPQPPPPAPSTTPETPTTPTTVPPTTQSTTSTPKPTTTEKPTVTPSTSTTAPPAPTTPTNNGTSTTAPPAHKGRHFDGPSFIGGIILASGLMAISFVSWKFYKARTEPDLALGANAVQLTRFC